MALTRATDKIVGDSNGNLNLSGIVTLMYFLSLYSYIGSYILACTGINIYKYKRSKTISIFFICKY